MTSKQFWCCVLSVALCIILAKPAEASGYPSTGAIVGGIFAVTAAVVVVAVVVIHKSTAKQTITGCVSSGENGIIVTDEKNRHAYVLSGNTAGIKPGDRMTLQGRKIKMKNAAKTLVWETKKVTNDFGVCQP